MDIKGQLNDPHRLAALRRTGAMDSGPEQSFDQICRLATELLKAPSAFVSLIDGKRHYIKSSCGDGEEGVDSFERDVSLEISFCKYVVASGEPWLVDDARENSLVRDSEAVQRGVIAYAGVPFGAEGETIGALCVVDSRPRHWSPGDIEKLNGLARSVEGLLSPAINNEESSDHSKLAGMFDALREHLRTLDDYRDIVGKPDINFSAERAALERVTKASVELHREFSTNSGLLGPGMEQLLLGLRQYFGAEERRRKAAEQFAGGSGQLGDLKAAIFEVSQAEDNLRLVALDSGLIS